MDKVTICHDCGRTIDFAYAYCPWCGTSVSGVDMRKVSEAIDEVCQKVERVRFGYDQSRLEKIEHSLCQMERELDRILA